MKTSSLGDVIHALAVLDYLKARFLDAKIDWAIDTAFRSLIDVHPLVRKVIPFSFKEWKNRWSIGQLIAEFKALRKEHYDYVFDLQGNVKSGLITAFAKAKKKVGFGFRSVREWPNVLATNVRFEVAQDLNIRLQYVELLKRFFLDETPFISKGMKFQISEAEREKIQTLLGRPALQGGLKVMVCPGSTWVNKQLKPETWDLFLTQVHKTFDVRYFFVWGNEEEKQLCRQLASTFIQSSEVVEKFSLPTWQNLISEVDLLIGVDSSALHFCATTSTPSFSIFGPTASQIFKPIGPQHFAFQGECPYGKSFMKSCPVLRTCPTGACIRDLKAESLFIAFSTWWKKFCLTANRS